MGVFFNEHLRGGLQLLGELLSSRPQDLLRELLRGRLNLRACLARQRLHNLLSHLAGLGLNLRTRQQPPSYQRLAHQLLACVLVTSRAGGIRPAGRQHQTKALTESQQQLHSCTTPLALHFLQLSAWKAPLQGSLAHSMYAPYMY